MNVLLVHNDYGKPSGEEYAVERISQLLQGNGHIVRTFRRSSAELVGSPWGAMKGFFCGIHNPYAARALDGYLVGNRPDVVVVQNIYPLLSASIFGVLHRHRLPVVMRCPNYRLFCPNGLHLAKGQVCERCLGPGREWWCVLRNCEDSILKSAGYALRNAVARVRGSITRRVHVFLVQSQFQKDRFIRNGIRGDRIEILPGMAHMNGCSEQVALGDVVSYVGRISPEKGIVQFIKAARLLPEIPFEVAGDDRQMPHLRSQAPNVRWLGFLDETQLHDLYLRSRMVVVPSLCYEGFPNVMIQAMALGKPLVCSDIGGLPEIIGYGACGVMVKPGNSEDLASKVRLLRSDPLRCRQLGSAGRERVHREYSPQVAYERLMTAFHKAIGANLRDAAVAQDRGVDSAADDVAVAAPSDQSGGV